MSDTADPAAADDADETTASDADSDGRQAPVSSWATPTRPDACPDCGSTQPLDEYWYDLPESAGRDAAFAYYECAACGAQHETQPLADVTSAPSVDVTVERIPNWQDVFGHPSPYEHQADGIETAIDTGESHGYLVAEGGCGTGKTMMALTAGLRLVRDPSTAYDRVLVLTSVKQQLRQFESDLRIINQSLPDDIDPVAGLSLQGKADVCPYQRTGSAGFTAANCHHKCKQLREQTAAAANRDTIAAADLYQDAARQSRLDVTDSLETAGAEAPYGEVLPEAAGNEVCPFYAKYLSQDNEVSFSVADAETGMMDTEELTRVATDHGVCPHSSMSALLDDADVVIANYYHAFDNATLNLTRSLIDESTFLVCDEAHMLVPRVRDILSATCDLSDLAWARHELARVLTVMDDAGPMQRTTTPSGAGGSADTAALSYEDAAPYRGHQVDPDIVADVFERKEVSVGVARQLYTALVDLETKLGEYVEQWVATEYPAWPDDPTAVPDQMEIPLRDPETPGPDVVSEWRENVGIPSVVWEEAEAIGAAVAEVLEKTDDDPESRHVDTVGEVLTQWEERGHTRYFRELMVRPTPAVQDASTPQAARRTARDQHSWPPSAVQHSWRPLLDAELAVHNCLPTALVANRLDSFGGGILMSATLEPMDIYQELVGLDYLSMMHDRRVTTRTYQASFPDDNRESLAVDVPAFTYQNRGSPSEATDTRKQYAEVMTTVAAAPGKTLVCMPSYREAEWAADVLTASNRVSKPVLVDSASDEAETQALKESFFDGGPKVLVTSLRGTLIEGVDYHGDRLHGVVVCGVPIPNVGSPQTKAVTTAYTEKFGPRNGFTYAMTVPAVRKTRQAIGRVIRGTEDVGVRVIADHRYCETGTFGSVREYLGHEQDEFDIVDPGEVADRVNAFWDAHETPWES